MDGGSRNILSFKSGGGGGSSSAFNGGTRSGGHRSNIAHDIALAELPLSGNSVTSQTLTEQQDQAIEVELRKDTKEEEEDVVERSRNPPKPKALGSSEVPLDTV